MGKQAVIQQFLKKMILPGVDVVRDNVMPPPSLPKGIAVATKDTLSLRAKPVDWVQLERLRSLQERGKKSGYNDYIRQLSESTNLSTPLSEGVQSTPSTSVSDSYLSLPSPLLSQLSSTSLFPSSFTISTYEGSSKKHTVKDFVNNLMCRYQTLEKMLRIRPELQGSISISRALRKQQREHVTIIGMVLDKKETKNGNVMLKLEDRTGSISVLINKGKPELFKQAQEMVCDEVVGVDGACGRGIIFANNLFWPDIPYSHELKKTTEETYALFLSDLHVGSAYFLPDEFNRFLRWINGDSGSKTHRAMAKKIQYIIVAGDIIDGVGIYPGQDKELTIPDIYKQYEECARLLARIPSHISIIICAGNHDAMRLAEPQPALDKEFARAVYDLPNVTVVSNPSWITLHNNDSSGGIDVLVYHGYSFDYYVAHVDSIRNSGGYHRSDLIMKYLLKRRHLAPAHGSTLRMPDSTTDPLVIHKVPDIFITGHIHYSMVANYRNVTMISGSCWQSTTDFQKKLGHKPEPARAPVINLKTREVKILKFM
jgi:DNA polymerase II small subunit